ncbi:MAG: hypothetical protein AAF288_05415 [Planctomycetota bacterium]
MRFGSTSHRPPTARRSGGFTLIEALVSLGAASVLVVALGGALTFASRSLSVGPVEAQRDTASWVDRLGQELGQATHIDEAGPGVLAFRVADRDGDGAPERIAYRWDGVSGSPITRTAGGVETQALDGVSGFVIEPTETTQTETFETPASTGIPLAPMFTHTPDSGGQAILATATAHVAQSFRPVLPEDATAWRITKLRVRARQPGSAGGKFRVNVHKLAYNSGSPAPAVELPRETAVCDDADTTSSFQWVEVSFGVDHAFAPDEAAMLVFLHDWLLFNFNDTGVELEHVPSGVDLGADAYLVCSHTGGFSWPDSATDAALVFEVEGEYDAAWLGGAPTLTRRFTESVSVAVDRPDAAGSVRHSVVLPNRPEKLDAEWVADFSSDPTVTDRDGDGAFDWVSDDGQRLTDLTDGVWTLYDRMISTAAEHSYTEPATVDVWMQHLWANAGDGTVRWIADDRGDGMSAMFELDLCLENPPAFTQTLKLRSYTSLISSVTVVTITDLPEEQWVHARLTLMPELGLINLRVNGQDYGSHRYPRFQNSLAGEVSIGPWISTSDDFQVDEVQVRVGGVAQ